MKHLLARMAAGCLLGGIGLLGGASCGGVSDVQSGPSTFYVVVTKVNGSAKLPTIDHPNPANRGDHDETWDFTVEARDGFGEIATDFNGVVRVSVVPGAVLNVTGEHAVGRNIQLIGGKAAGEATLTAVYGPARLWVQDLGYFPAPAGQVAACSDGKDNDGDVAIDFPADPGCAFPDDASEEGGSYVGGASQEIEYARPSIVDVQGEGAQTPYPNDAIEINAAAPHQLVVTRVSSDGFYVTDVSPDAVASGYNSLFAFNFSTPTDMRPCDIVTYLAGTANDFFGFTELNFPSYELKFPIAGVDACLIPEPTVLTPAIIGDPVALEKVESGLIRLLSGPKTGDTNPDDPTTGTYIDMTWTMPKNFGPDVVVLNASGPNASSCDLNGDGQVDFTDAAEGACSNACDQNPDCSEWTSFTARGNIKVKGTYVTVDKATGARSASSTVAMQINVGASTEFDPTANRGLKLGAVTGTLRNFSGGNLNWTVEARCGDDLVCNPAVPGCKKDILGVDTACISLRTIDDNDEGTN